TSRPMVIVITSSCDARRGGRPSSITSGSRWSCRSRTRQRSRSINRYASVSSFALEPAGWIMALSREDFLNATPDNPPTMPDGVFGPPEERGPEWPDNPDLRAAVDWFKSFMTPEDWHARRVAAFVLL